MKKLLAATLSSVAMVAVPTAFSQTVGSGASEGVVTPVPPPLVPGGAPHVNERDGNIPGGVGDNAPAPDASGAAGAGAGQGGSGAGSGQGEGSGGTAGGEGSGNAGDASGAGSGGTGDAGDGDGDGGGSAGAAR